LLKLAQAERKGKSALTNGANAFIFIAKIEAQGSSVSSGVKAAFAGAERERCRSGETQLRVSLLGRRRRSAGLSREWSAIEYRIQGRGPGFAVFSCAVDANRVYGFFRASVKSKKGENENEQHEKICGDPFGTGNGSFSPRIRFCRRGAKA
jgi:hypothetical protein